MGDIDRLVWSFGAIAVFGVFVLLFRRRQSSHWVGLISIGIAIALTIAIAMQLISA